MNKPEAPLFRVIIKPNPKARKVMFYLTSYRKPWYVFKVSIEKLRRMGYEVMIYDFNDYILNNSDPGILPKAIYEVIADINTRKAAYEKRGIKVFDGAGHSLGSFFLFNYATRYPLRKVVLNVGGIMSKVIFNAHDRSIVKTKQRYQNLGYNLEKLSETWEDIDSPTALGSNMKAQRVLFYTVARDSYVSVGEAQTVIDGIKASAADLAVYANKRLGHKGAVFKNAHSSKFFKFLSN